MFIWSRGLTIEWRWNKANNPTKPVMGATCFFRLQAE
jgi:hypothetical protein